MNDVKQNSQASRLDKTRILIVDDHRNIRLSLRLILEQEGAIVNDAETLGLARSTLGFRDGSPPTELPYDLILLDLRLPDGSGLDLLRVLSDAKHGSHIIIISGEGTTAEAFKATQMGAFDYIEKPFTHERILVSVRRALDFNRIQTINADLEKSAHRQHEMLGDHQKLREIQDLIQRVGPTSGRVLITGESGTGKELVARAIHRASNRRDMLMIKVNCAAIPHGLMESELFGHEKGAFTGAVKTRIGMFERANGGTLFLDEIGELDMDLQAKLLRVLQSGEYTRVGGEKTLTTDVRLIAATNRDLRDRITAGEFREDLYYRLNVVTIHTPPLRERVSDIPVLARRFLEEACEEHSLGQRTLGDGAISDLQAWHWPGNIRELKNLIERIAILAEEPLIDHIEELEALRKSSPGPLPTKARVENEGSEDVRLHVDAGVMTWQAFHEMIDREFLGFVLKQAKGNVSEAARLLELERAYLHRLMKKLGIQREG